LNQRIREAVVHGLDHDHGIVPVHVHGHDHGLDHDHDHVNARRDHDKRQDRASSSRTCDESRDLNLDGQPEDGWLNAWSLAIAADCAATIAISILIAGQPVTS
jgi:hypothetical protein